jgi:MIP family channel proteins
VTLAVKTDDLRRYTCEFIGTFSLVFFAAGAVVVSVFMGDSLGAIGGGLISGLIITVVIYGFGHISGAHVNPALSIAAALIGHLDWRLVPGYVFAQCAGSVLGGMCLLWAIGDYGAMGANLPNTEMGIAPATALLIELFLSFLLMWVVAGVGLDKRAHGPFAGVAVGAVVGIEVMLMGPVAGAAMNPARALGPYVAMGDFSHYWIYVAGPLIGMALGAYAYRFTHALGGRAV